MRSAVQTRHFAYIFGGISYILLIKYYCCYWVMTYILRRKIFSSSLYKIPAIFLHVKFPRFLFFFLIPEIDHVCQLEETVVAEQGTVSV